jgi:molecular chaperone IbpA
MRPGNFASLHRSTVGFERLASILEAVSKQESATDPFPPYNIERTGEQDYRITLAVAGFDQSELTIDSRENVLTVKGEHAPEDVFEKREFLFRGIAGRAFERRFQLADHVEVKGASLANGLLNIELSRVVPEALKPRKIDITVAGNANPAPVLEDTAAETQAEAA